MQKKEHNILFKAFDLIGFVLPVFFEVTMVVNRSFGLFAALHQSEECHLAIVLNWNKKNVFGLFEKVMV